MDAPGASNKRFIVAAGLVASQEVANAMRSEVPGARERVPKGQPGNIAFPGEHWRADNSRAKNILGLKFKSATETFSDLGRQLLELEKNV